MTRYTKEDGRKFMEEEAKRSAEETAAYYAWKRGETPLGTSPTYIPPSASSSSSFTSTSSSPSPSSASSYSSDSPPPENEPSAFEHSISTSTGESYTSPQTHLFDDPLFNSPDSALSQNPSQTRL